MTKKGTKKDTAAETSEEAKTLSHHAQRSLDERKKGTCEVLGAFMQLHADVWACCAVVFLP